MILQYASIALGFQNSRPTAEVIPEWAAVRRGLVMLQDFFGSGMTRVSPKASFPETMVGTDYSEQTSYSPVPMTHEVYRLDNLVGPPSYVAVAYTRCRSNNNYVSFGLMVAQGAGYDPDEPKMAGLVAPSTGQAMIFNPNDAYWTNGVGQTADNPMGVFGACTANGFLLGFRSSASATSSGTERVALFCGPSYSPSTGQPLSTVAAGFFAYPANYTTWYSPLRSGDWPSIRWDSLGSVGSYSEAATLGGGLNVSGQGAMTSRTLYPPGVSAALAGPDEYLMSGLLLYIGGSVLQLCGPGSPFQVAPNGARGLGSEVDLEGSRYQVVGMGRALFSDAQSSGALWLRTN